MAKLKYMVMWATAFRIFDPVKFDSLKKAEQFAKRTSRKYAGTMEKRQTVDVTEGSTILRQYKSGRLKYSAENT